MSFVLVVLSATAVLVVGCGGGAHTSAEAHLAAVANAACREGAAGREPTGQTAKVRALMLADRKLTACLHVYLGLRCAGKVGGQRGARGVPHHRGRRASRQLASGRIHSAQTQTRSRPEGSRLDLLLARDQRARLLHQRSQQRRAGHASRSCRGTTRRAHPTTARDRRPLPANIRWPLDVCGPLHTPSHRHGACGLVRPRTEPRTLAGLGASRRRAAWTPDPHRSTPAPRRTSCRMSFMRAWLRQFRQGLSGLRSARP